MRKIRKNPIVPGGKKRMYQSGQTSSCLALDMSLDVLFTNWFVGIITKSYNLVISFMLRVLSQLTDAKNLSSLLYINPLHPTLLAFYLCVKLKFLLSENSCNCLFRFGISRVEAGGRVWMSSFKKMKRASCHSNSVFLEIIQKYTLCSYLHAEHTHACISDLADYSDSFSPLYYSHHKKSGNFLFPPLITWITFWFPTDWGKTTAAITDLLNRSV